MDFVSFMTDEQRPLLRLAAALSGDAVTADDIVADVLGRVYEQWGRISALDRVDAYVRRMVVNEFLSRKRRQRRIVLTAEWDEQAVVGSDHAGDYIEQQSMKSRIARLPRRQRAALVLRYYEELPDAEIAAALDCAVSTVRSLIFRALAALRVDPDERNRASGITPLSTLMEQETF